MICEKNWRSVTKCIPCKLMSCFDIEIQIQIQKYKNTKNQRDMYSWQIDGLCTPSVALTQKASQYSVAARPVPSCQSVHVNTFCQKPIFPIFCDAFSGCQLAHVLNGGWNAFHRESQK